MRSCCGCAACSGLFAFSYALLHFLVYLGPYRGFDWQEIAKDIGKRPYMTLGFCALLLLTPLAATSTDRMMRRLGQALADACTA